MALHSRQRVATTTGRIASPGAAIGAVLLGHKIAPRGLRGAIDAGWIVRVPSTITRRALRVIDHEVLWLALHLDVDEIDAGVFSRKLRERSEQWAADARTLRERAALIGRALSPGLDRALARQLRDRQGARIVGTMLADLEHARDVLILRAAFAADWRLRYEQAITRAERRRSPRYAGRWRAAVLGWLLRRLGAKWTRRNLAELIIASMTDFTREHRPPCSAFVDGNDVDMFADRIKHMLARHA